MRKLFSLFAALTLSVGLWAETVPYRYPEYIDSDVTKGIDMWQISSKDATPVTSSSSTWGAAGQETWLVVSENATISQRITCQGDVRLILADDVTLNATQGITVSGESNSLTIYAQTEDIAHMGQLIATGGDNAAGIGGGNEQDGSYITINGGEVTATGAGGAAGIGGGMMGAGSFITINGGEVEATGGDGGAGIGGGNEGSGYNITINGGQITATGNYGAGIGGGEFGEGSNITINGGVIMATSVSGGAGIGGGNGGSGSNITINGGEVTANGASNAAGIGGGGNGGSGSYITINGGEVEATGGEGAAGIGGGGNGGSGSNITINGGIITTAGGYSASGIGGGEYGDGSNITINGGKVRATGGYSASGIGGGANAFGSNIFVATSLQVKADGNNPPTTVITNTGADLASSLAGKRYATIELAPAGPEVGEQFFDATSGLFFKVTAVGDNNTVKVIPSEYEKSSYIIPASVTYKNVALAVTEIDEVAFADRDALNSITIPASVITIGEYAFEYCDNLATVTFAEGSQLQTIGAWAFNNCKVLPNITIPASVTEIGEKTFLQCTALTDIYVEAANTHYISEDGVLFDYAKDKLIQYPIGNTRTTYTIPTTVTTIELFSFFNATLISVNIPASVTTIGESAFNECEALTSINIPASVTEIGELAFAFCPNLATITFSEGSQLTTIGYGAFSGCEVISSLDIPASVTKIGKVAFCCNPNLYNVTVHWTDANQLPEMGEEVFVGIAEEEGPSAATLHVPTGTKDMYEAADQWQDFIIEELAPAVEVYTRDVTEGNWGTICLPWESKALEGGIFYDVLGTIHAEYGVALTEIEEPNQLEAGKPYVFKATSDQIKVTYYPLTQVEAPVYDENHLYGSFEGCDVPEGKYIIYNNLLYITDGSSKIGTNRAYFDVASMEAYNPLTAPARVVFFGGRQAPTGFGQWNKEQGQRIMKVVENGQFIIIKDNKMYNAQGIEL